MLILGRRWNERVFITGGDGERTVLTAIGVRDGSVRLGFEAPASVVIHREETQLKVDREKGGAA